jgi:hypothetical protein
VLTPSFSGLGESSELRREPGSLPAGVCFVRLKFPNKNRLSTCEKSPGEDQWQESQTEPDLLGRGDGQMALIVGEPGLGKSRLIEEFHARLRDTPHTWVEWSYSRLLQNTPLHRWNRAGFDQLRRLLGNQINVRCKIAVINCEVLALNKAATS